MDKPYTEKILGNTYYRTFNATTDEMDLIWHRDAEDRWVQALHNTDWQFQFDNQLPISFDRMIYIPKETIHRVIKGTGELRIAIHKWMANFEYD